MNAVLALGTNLGDRFAQLRSAVERLDAQVTVRTVSPVYETAPVGGPEQGPYLNAVVLAEAELDPAGWLALAQAVERSAGRERGVRWGPRSLDVDIIDVRAGTGGDGITSADPVITLPHPRAAGRAFVLVPWLAADPAAVLTGHGSVAELLAGLDTSGVCRRDDLGPLR